MLATTSHAGKLKTAKSFLPVLEQSAKQVETQIDQLDAYLKGIGQTGSFLTTDFWGTSPAWYLNPNHTGVTSHYPFHKILDSSLRGDKRDSLFVRKIKNVVLSPLKVDTWSMALNFDYSFLFDREYNRYSSGQAVKAELLANRVPEVKLDEALQYYYDHYIEAESLYLNSIIPTLDGLYGDVLFNESAIKAPKFRAIFGDDLPYMDKHPEILKANLESLKLGSMHMALRLKSLDELKAKLKSGELSSDAFTVFVNLARYSFQVGSKMTESQKTSQIFDFSELLKAKSRAGKAAALPYDAKASDARKIFGRNSEKVTVYQDADEGLKYRGMLFFDENTGKGLWQTALWQSKTDLEALKTSIAQANEELKKATTTYLDMALRETILKFAPADDQQEQKGQASDF